MKTRPSRLRSSSGWAIVDGEDNLVHGSIRDSIRSATRAFAKRIGAPWPTMRTHAGFRCVKVSVFWNRKP